MYTYIAKVIRVVDGDTVIMKVDVGFHVTVKERFRLSSIDTAEIYRPRNAKEKAHGLKAKALVEKYLLGKKVLVKTKKNTGKFGRWIATIYPLDKKGEPALESMSVVLKAAGMEKRKKY